MIAALLQLIEHHLGGRLASLAHGLHVLVFLALAAGWGWPLIRFFFFRWHRTDARWTPSWSCPQCGHLNPATILSCEKCRTEAESSLWQKIASLPALRALRRLGRLAGSVAAVLGGLVFYVSTVLLAVRFRFFSFHQKPMTEFLAGLAMGLWLFVLYFFRRAFGLKPEPALSRFTDAVAGLGIAGFFLGVVSLWASAPFANRPALLRLDLRGDGAVYLPEKNNRRVQAVIDKGTGEVQFRVKYAVVSWPLFYVDQAYGVRLGGEDLIKPGSRWLTDLFSRRLGREDPFRPRVAVLDQTVQAPAGMYALVKSAEGGLVLKKEGEK